MGQLAINGDTTPINYNSKVIPQISVCGRANEEGQDAKTNQYSSVSYTHHYCDRHYSGVAKTHLYSGVAIDPITNNIYLADYRKSSVSVYNDTGVYLFEFGIDNNAKNDYKMNGPTCIVCYNETLFISQTGSHCILMYDMDGKLIGKFGSYGSNDGQLDSPRGLAICSYTGDIYVCDSRNNRVAVFQSDFKHKTNISGILATMGLRHLSLNSPHDVKLTKDKIFVLDSNELCVHMYNLSNKRYAQSIISCGSHNKYIMSAYFLVIDKDGNIIISDSGTNSVNIFTKEGKFFHQIGGSTTDQLSNPGGIAIDNKNRLVIANNKQDAIIQMY